MRGVLIAAEAVGIAWLLRRGAAHRRAAAVLRERLQFEMLRASLAATFTPLVIGDLDREIQGALRRVTAFLGAAGGSIIEFARDRGVARAWATEHGLDPAGFPWLTARLRGGAAITLRVPEDLPDDAAVDRRSYLSLGVRPQVAIPLVAGRSVVGALVLGALGERHARSTALLPQLGLLGEVFANALARRQGELEIQRLRQELAHVGRVSAMGELTASLAHELNQPLTAILSNAQAAQRLLAAGDAKLEEIREILDDIIADDRRAGGVIHRLRSLLKKGDPEFVVLDLNETAAEVARLVRNDTVARHVAMRLELAAGLPEVRGDRAQLQQVVLNLVLNGLEAMQGGARAGDRTLVIRTARDGAEGVRLAVRDSGPGIDEAHVDRLFQPLHTTKPEGLGMGLAIARTIVEAHGGRLGAANNPAGGATFHFTLPAATRGER